MICNMLVGLAFQSLAVNGITYRTNGRSIASIAIDRTIKAVADGSRGGGASDAWLA